jgi:hypothetical protein
MADFQGSLAEALDAVVLDDDLAISIAYPEQSLTLHFTYFRDCDHYGVRVTTLGATPMEEDKVVIDEGGLDREEVEMRVGLMGVAEMMARDRQNPLAALIQGLADELGEEDDE